MLYSNNNDLKAYADDAKKHIQDHYKDHNQRYLPPILGLGCLYHIGHAFAYQVNLFNMKSILPDYYFHVEIIWGVLFLLLSQLVYRSSLRRMGQITGVSLLALYMSSFMHVYLFDYMRLPLITLLGIIVVINLTIYARYTNLVVSLLSYGLLLAISIIEMSSLPVMFEINITVSLWLIISLFINSVIIQTYTKNLERDHHFRTKSDDLEKKQQDLEHRHMDVQRNRQFLSTILRQLSTSVAIFDEKGRVIDSNESMRLYFSKLFDSTSKDENIQLIREEMKNITARHSQSTLEINQNNRIFKIKFSRIQGENRTSSSILVEATDITDLKKQQIELGKVIKVRDILITINNLITKESNLDSYFDYILEQLVNVFDHGEIACVLLMDENHILRPAFTYGYDIDDIPNFAIELETSFMYKQVGHVPNRTVILTDIQNDLGDGCPPLLATDESFAIRSSLCTPIIVNDNLYGLLNIDSSTENGFSDEDITIMEYFREHLASVVANQAIMRHTIHLSKCDPLTNLYNRWVLDEIKREEYHRWISSEISVAVVAIDLNSLKQINDTYGHDAGDEYLTVLAESLRETFRMSDLLLRIGGDEFLCILPSCSAEKANEKAFKANQHFINECHGKFGNYDFGFSYGIAVSPEETDNFDELIKLADTRMYVAKNNYRAKQ